MIKILKVIKVELPDDSSYESFKEDGLDVYCVRLNVIGIDHDIWMTVPGESEDDAVDIALDSIVQIKYNDISVEDIIKIEE